MLKLPRSNSRSRRVSIPAIRRAFKTWKRWPRSGWNGWRISAHPKCELRSGAVRAHRRYPQRPQLPIRFWKVNARHRLRLVGLRAQRVLYPFQESRYALVRLPNLLDRDAIHPARSLITAHPLPTTPEGPASALACCFLTGVFRLHPARRTGRLRLANEAESGSLALRLACRPCQVRQIDFSIPRLLGYMSEQAIYMVNSFQFTRSARLILAYRPSGSAFTAGQ